MMPVKAEEASGSATIVSMIVPILAIVGTSRLALTPSFGYLMGCPSALMSSGGTDLIYYLFWAILRDPQFPLQ